MSLILDALRRADAERGRGAVPGLHTPQPMPPAAPPMARSRTPLVVAAVLGSVAVAGAAGWWWSSRDGRVGVPEVATVAQAPAMPTQPVVVASPVAAPPAATTVAPAATTPRAETVAPKAATGPGRVAAAPAPAATRPVLESGPAPLPAPAPVPAPAVAPASAPTARVPLLQELSPTQRQQLPQLSVAGASYSANPAYRMVIVNGQVLHEGDEAAPGVVLESIAPRQVVLRGQGQRWAVGY